MEDQNLDKIWFTYSKSRDPVLKEKLILEYIPLVRYVAGRLSIHIGSHVEYNDLVSYGIFGLIDAIDKFDCAKGVKFETYASLRIRGSIIDNIRRLDWVPRTLRQKNKQLDKTYSDLETRLGRSPEAEELASELNLTLEETQNLMKNSSFVSLISLDDFLDQNHESTFDSPSALQTDGPEASYMKEELRQILIDAIDKLNDKEKQVVTLYYFEELTLKEISVIMGVSESRVSQIHTKSLVKMRSKLGKYRSVLFST